MGGSETSKHKDLAADFLNFLLSKDVQNMLATEAGLPFNASDDYSIDSLPDELKNPLKTFDDMQDSAKEFNTVFEQCSTTMRLRCTRIGQVPACMML